MKTVSNLKGFSGFALLFSIPIAYLLGAISSGIGSIIENKLIQNRCLLKGVFPDEKGIESETELLKRLKSEVEKRLCPEFDTAANFIGDKHFFYFVRTLVGEFLPNSTESAGRQDSLRQMRRNSFVPVFFFWGVGAVWGVFGDVELIHKWQMGILAVAFFWGPIVLWILWQGIINNNIRRERDIYLGLLALPCVLHLKDNSFGCHKSKPHPGSVVSSTEENKANI